MSFPTILIIDDHALFRSGLRMVLSSGLDNVQIFEAGSLEQGLQCDMAPALILLDIRLQGLNGLESIGLLKRQWPQVIVVIVSSEDGPETVRLSSSKGAAAFVSKGDSASSIISVVRQVLAGQKLPDARTDAALCGAARLSLTPRQSQVLDLLCQGLPNKVIGRRLGLSENTVRGHVQAVLGFLQVSNRSEAAFAARRLGLVG